MDDILRYLGKCDLAYQEAHEVATHSPSDVRVVKARLEELEKIGLVHKKHFGGRTGFVAYSLWERREEE